MMPWGHEWHQSPRESRGISRPCRKLLQKRRPRGMGRWCTDPRALSWVSNLSFEIPGLDYRIPATDSLHCNVRGRCQHAHHLPSLFYFTTAHLPPALWDCSWPLAFTGKPGVNWRLTPTATVRFKVGQTLKYVTPWPGAMGNNPKQ